MAIDQNGATSLSAQVKADILGKVQSGSFPVGRQIPSLKKLMAEYGVAELTVHAAIKELQHEGVLESSAGRGTFVKAVPSSADTEADLRSEIAVLRTEVAELRERVAALEDTQTGDQ